MHCYPILNLLNIYNVINLKSSIGWDLIKTGTRREYKTSGEALIVAKRYKCSLVGGVMSCKTQDKVIKHVPLTRPEFNSLIPSGPRHQNCTVSS